MIYHQPISLPNWKPATLQVYSFIKEHTSILHIGAFWNILNRQDHAICYNALDPVFQAAGFNLLRISFLIVNQPRIDIHQDTDFINGYPDRLARINIPIINCEHSETRFYSPIEWAPVDMELPNGIKYTYHEDKNCKLESSMSLTEPTILRVRELHNVNAKAGSYPRLALTCAVDPDPVYLLEGI